MLLGDVVWETSYGLPGEGLPPRVVAHITFDWPTWSQTSYRRWYVDEVLDEHPAIEMEIVFRVQRLADQPDPALVRGGDARGQPADRQRAAGAGRLDGRDRLPRRTPAPSPDFAIEVTYEGLYELAEETLADGASTLLDEHFGGARRLDRLDAGPPGRPPRPLPPPRRGRGLGTGLIFVAILRCASAGS